MEPLLPSNGIVSSDNDTNEAEEDRAETAVDAESYLLEVSQNPLRWGAVETPASWKQQYTDQGDVAGHLSFGTREHDPQEPVHGQWYA